jgi:hypothetical protein
MSFSLSNQAERDEQSLWQVRVRGEAHAGISRRDIRRKSHLENLGLQERSTFKWMGRSWMGRCGLDSSGLGMWKLMGCCEHCNLKLKLLESIPLCVSIIRRNNICPTQLFTKNLLVARQDDNCFGHTSHHQVINTRMLNTVMNLRVPENTWTFWRVKELFVFKDSDS